MTTAIGSSTSAGSAGSSTFGLDPTNQLGANAFLQLLITELKNQDPTQPMDGKDMIAQLAQLNQTQFTQQSLTAQQVSLAASLIGKSVAGTVNGQAVTGPVSAFAVDGSTVTLTVGDQQMNVNNVTQVAADSAHLTTTSSSSTTSTTGGN